MSPLIEKLDQLLFPEKLRPYITFRLVTVFVAVLAMGSLALDILNAPEAPHETAAQIHKLVLSPRFLMLQAFILAVGFWLIYRTREKKLYYRFRVFFYGMLLGGLAGEILDFLLLLRR